MTELTSKDIMEQTNLAFRWVASFYEQQAKIFAQLLDELESGDPPLAPVQRWLYWASSKHLDGTHAWWPTYSNLYVTEPSEEENKDTWLSGERAFLGVISAVNFDSSQPAELPSITLAVFRLELAEAKRKPTTNDFLSFITYQWDGDDDGKEVEGWYDSPWERGMKKFSFPIRTWQSQVPLYEVDSTEKIKTLLAEPLRRKFAEVI